MARNNLRVIILQGLSRDTADATRLVWILDPLHCNLPPVDSSLDICGTHAIGTLPLFEEPGFAIRPMHICGTPHLHCLPTSE